MGGFWWFEGGGRGGSREGATGWESIEVEASLRVVFGAGGRTFFEEGRFFFEGGGKRRQLRDM